MSAPFYLLKLNILKNSVLEGPGLDFRGPGSWFWRSWASFFVPLASFFNVWHVLNGSTKVHEIFVDFLGCPCKNTSQILTKIEDVISPCAFCNAVLHMQAYKAWGSPNIPAHKWGGGGGPPLGEFNGIDIKIHAFFNLLSVPFFIERENAIL